MTPEELRALVDEQDRQTLAAETDMVAAAVGPVRAAVRAIARAFARLWERIVGTAEATAELVAHVARELVGELARLLAAAPLVGEALVEHAPRLYALGVAHGAEQAAAQGSRRRRRNERATFIPRRARSAIDDASKAVVEQTKTAEKVLLSARSRVDLEAGVAATSRAARRAEAIARWVATTMHAEGVNAVAEAQKLPVVWVAERDGCLACAAYSGEVDRGNGFREGLTYGDRPLKTGPVEGPPLHPNCRCGLLVWDPNRPGPQVPAALKREARRSVVRGWSLPSESEASRLRAADRLLRSGAGLPKSVEAFGRRAVLRGRFPTRDVPRQPAPTP
jgi:hypothetical protein